MQLQQMHADDLPAAVTQRAYDGSVGAATDRDTLPPAGISVAACGAASAVEEGFDDPRVAAYGLATKTAAKEAAILQVVDRARGNHADAERVGAAAAALGPVLSDHAASGWRRVRKSSWPRLPLRIASSKPRGFRSPLRTAMLM